MKNEKKQLNFQDYIRSGIIPALVSILIAIIGLQLVDVNIDATTLFATIIIPFAIGILAATSALKTLTWKQIALLSAVSSVVYLAVLFFAAPLPNQIGGYTGFFDQKERVGFQLWFGNNWASTIILVYLLSAIGTKTGLILAKTLTNK